MAEALAVVDKAFLKCTLGVGLTRLKATTVPPVIMEYRTLATIKDHLPDINVPPFRRCKKLGGKCVPDLPGPWEPNLFSGVVAAPSIAGVLPSHAQLHCEVGGDIFIVVPGQSTVSIGEADRLLVMESELRRLFEEYERFLKTGRMPPDWERMAAVIDAGDRISSTLDRLDLASRLADKLRLPGGLKKFIRRNPFGASSEILSQFDRNKLKEVFNEIQARNIERLVRKIQRERGIPSDLPRRGGPHRRVRAQHRGGGGEVHHMPSKEALTGSPLSAGQGPSILMDWQDHRRTKSHGRKREANAYRAKQKRLIEQGRFNDAQQMDIDDVRKKFGSKYDNEIEQMLEYTARTPTQ